MVGNKAQKAVAAALTGVLAFGGIAPAFAGVWTGDEGASWYRINGDHTVTYQLGTLNDDDELSKSGYTKEALSGTEAVKGENRYDTAWDAINYNRDKYKGTKYMVIASGTSQADALVASGVAGMLKKDQLIKNDETLSEAWNKLEEKMDEGTVTDADLEAFDELYEKVLAEAVDVPVMITPSDKLCEQAKRAIQWVADNSGVEKAEDFKVYMVGGTAALSEDVEDAIAAIKIQGTKEDEKKEISVDRLAGENRVETSLKAAQVIDDEGWLDEDLEKFQNTVYVANGVAWPDALSVSSYAYTYSRPLLLTGSDGLLSADQLDYLKKKDETVSISVVGGPAQPSAQQLWDAGFKQARVNYMAGENRYETSAMVIKDEGVLGLKRVVAVASGAEGHWADALIGGPFVGANGGVLALVDGIDEVTALKQAYSMKKDSEGKGKTQTAETGEWSYIIGGEAAIDKKFADKLNDKFPVDPATVQN